MKFRLEGFKHLKTLSLTVLKTLAKAVLKKTISLHIVYTNA